MRTVFPVIALKPEQAGEMARADFFGTAFAVGPGVFMTAAHVARNAEAHGAVAIGGPSSVDGHAPLGAVRVQQIETWWPDHDVALLYVAAVAGLTELKMWLTNRLQLLTDLGSFGYPHAITVGTDRMQVVFRGYKGYVITTRGWERLPGEPPVYEVSCAFPLGMSGAPVLLACDGVLAVAGIVLGISTVEYGGVAQDVGIVMPADQIVSLHSGRLGGPIGTQLEFVGCAFLPSDSP